MSEHAWILENLESYTAGGLEPAERERLEEHIASCTPCAAALKETRALDQRMETLFAGVRPKATLEDRMIGKLRAAPAGWGLKYWIPLYAAAVLLLGIVGAGASQLVANGSLTFPGSWERPVAQNNLQQLGQGQHKFHNTYGVVNRAAEPITVTLKHVDELARDVRSQSVSALDGSESMTTEKSEPQQPGYFRRSATGNFNTGPVERSAEGGFGGGGGMANMMSPRVKDGESYSRPAQEDGRASGAMMGMMGRASAPETRPEGRKQIQDTTENQKEAEPHLEGNKPAGGPAQDAPGKGENNLRGPPLNPNGELKQYYGYSNNQPTTPPPVAFSFDGKKEAGKEGPPPGGLARPQEPGKPSSSLQDDHFRPSDGSKTSPDDKIEKKEEAAEAAGRRATELAQNKDPGKPAPQGQGRGGEKRDSNQAGAPEPAPATPRKIIIRSGDIEFEIESFDSAVATITKLVTAIRGGFVATVNSEKLANGKVRGSVVVRMPPESLDTFVLDLRKELGRGGELKGLRIGSQDITKQYTDLESRLKAARTMEERLLNIIKTGKGEIKDLLNAEKELGVWRTKIEETEGELKYYSNLASLSTLTITLAEKEIRAPYAILETERVQMGLEVEDVDKAQQQALAAVAAAKGRVTRSELKQMAAGQFQAVIHFEVAPEAAGALRDRLNQLGTVARLEIDRLQQPEGGTGKPEEGAKSKRKDTRFELSLYNLANIAPRETVHMNLACVDTEEAYKKILDRVEKAKGRVRSSNLNRQRNDQTTGTIEFEVKSADAGAVQLDLKDLGEVMRLQITENPDTANVTRSKRGFNIQLFALGMVSPRETNDVQMVTKDVPAGYRALQDAVVKAKGRILRAQLNEQNRENITADLDFDVRRSEEPAIRAEMDKIGDIFSRAVQRAQDSDNVIDSKVLYRLKLNNVTGIPAREVHVLGIEVRDVDTTQNAIANLVRDSQGRQVDGNVAREPNGRVTGKFIFEVPLGAADGLVNKIKGIGIVRVQRSSRNTQVPDSALALARLEVTLSNQELIVPSDEGPWTQMRKGLSNSLVAIFWSLSWLIFGVLVLLPWALIIYAIYRIVLRLRRKPDVATPAA